MSELTVPPEVVKNYPAWFCHFHDAPHTITVGTPWSMTCEGASGLKPPLQLQFPDDAMVYSLAIVDIKKFSDQGAEFSVTGYKAGAFQPPYVVLTDGSAAVRVEGLKWDIASVLPQEKGSQPPQPFPPYGPYIFNLPWWYWAQFVAVGFAILIALLCAWFWHRRRHKEKLKLRQLETKLTPYMELHRDLRQLLRESNRDPVSTLARLAHVFREYVSRKYQFFAVPMPSYKLVLRLSRINKQFDSLELGSFLSELDRVRLNSQGVTHQDAEQLIEMARLIADQMEKVKS